MRVIETFVKYVPREAIPTDAKWFMQDDSGELKSSPFEREPESYNGWWCRGSISSGNDVFGNHKLATDAAETVVTREELMKAYDLVEQGDTLWFGGDCPAEKGTLADVIYRNGDENLHVEAGVSPCNTGSIPEKNASDWGSYGFSNDIIAHRLSEGGTKLEDLAPLSEEKVKAIQSVIANNQTKTWSYHPDSILVNKETGIFCSGADNFAIITKDEWNTYLDSIKIEVGDTVSFIHSDAFYKVLYVGEEKAFIKDSDGTEYSFPLGELSKVIK